MEKNLKNSVLQSDEHRKLYESLTRALDNTTPERPGQPWDETDEDSKYKLTTPEMI